MNIDDLEEALSEIFTGGFHIGSDDNGQLIIYTQLTDDGDGDLVKFESEDEEDDDIDPDFEPLADDDDD